MADPRSALRRVMLPLMLSLAAAHASHAIGAVQTPADIGIASSAAIRTAPMPRKPSMLPPSHEELLYDLAPSDRLRPELMTPEMRRQLRERQREQPGLASEPGCPSMDVLAGYRGSALAEQVAKLPDASCANDFFTLKGERAAAIFAVENVEAAAAKFSDAAYAYRAPDRSLVNMSLFLRAAYFLADSGQVAPMPPAVADHVRPAISQLLSGGELFAPNAAAPTTAGEVVTLIVNMRDEARYLDLMTQSVRRFTNTSTAPDAARALRDANAGNGFTAVLKVFYFAHTRPDALPRIASDPSFADTLYTFVKANKASLLGDPNAGYQLNQAANEAFRFAMHPALLSTVAPMIRDALASSTMAGADSLIWLAAAQAVKSYDNGNCASYGTCNFEEPLAAAILPNAYSCPGLKVRLRTQSLSANEARQACSTLRFEAPRFHDMLKTNKIVLADDYNDSLEVIVFASRVDYHNYSAVLFGNDTNNGGVYLEGNPAVQGNQARFIAFVATWLRPTFQIWNLKHEYIHYLDGRFNMYGDFEAATKVPTVWYIEGLAEYVSRGNDDPEAIDAAKTGRYRLREILANTYSMDDYVSRAYRWGYMAMRFMFERRPEVLDTILPMFRRGDYAAYWTYIQRLPPVIDKEFAAWVSAVAMDVEPAQRRHAD